MQCSCNILLKSHATAIPAHYLETIYPQVEDTRAQNFQILLTLKSFWGNVLITQVSYTLHPRPMTRFGDIPDLLPFQDVATGSAWFWWGGKDHTEDTEIIMVGENTNMTDGPSLNDCHLGYGCFRGFFIRPFTVYGMLSLHQSKHPVIKHFTNFCFYWN